MLAVLVFSCSNDDDIPTDPVGLVPVNVQFGEDTFFSENTEDNDITIQLHKPAIEAGTITVKVITDAPLFFETVPAITNNEIVIQVVKGAEDVTFKFNPRDDWFIDGHKLVTFELKSVSQGFIIGSKANILVEIFDDELKWKPKSFETIAGENKTKKSFEYMQDGKLAKVQLLTETSQGTNTTTLTYVYDAHNRLHLVQYSTGENVFFTWENGKITKSDHLENGIITSYKTYNYDNDGKIGSVNITERNIDNTYGITTVETYEYLNDNLKKKEVWTTENMLTWQLVSKQVFDSYLSKENPFQLNEILPLYVTQPNLPLSLSLEENGATVLFNYTYEYNSTGRPLKRTATGEVTTYSYY